MPLPVRHLPVVQNWDCHACGGCCKEYTVHVTPAERRKIEEQGWAQLPEYAGVPLVVREGWLGGRYRLNHRADGSCVFLDERGLCKIHGKFGGNQKPLACQVYPYVLIPAGDHWRVGVRYACPSASANRGRAVGLQRAEIAAFAGALEEREGVRRRDLRPTPLRGRQRVSWDDLGRIVSAMVRILKKDEFSIEYRWRWMLAVATIVRATKFDAVNGRRLEEFLEVLAEGVAGDLPSDAAQVPPPTRIGGVLFRLTAALYCRRDTGARRGVVQRSRWALLRAATRFARGTGAVPRLHAAIPEVSFEQMEEPAGPPDGAATALLERYYRVKLESYQFFGPIHFGHNFWDGFDALSLTLPVILWLSRAWRDRPRAEAVESAVQIVDDNFGYNPMLGSWRQRWVTRILSSRGEVGRLAAQYSK